MGKKNRLSRDQKRRAKLKVRDRHVLSSRSSAYAGRKYQRTELIQFFFTMERGIHTADLLTQRSMTDADVESAIEILITELRRDGLPESVDQIEGTEGTIESLIIDQVLDEWHDAFETRQRPSNGDLIGILRTTLGSLETRRGGDLSRRGYLEYLKRFLKSGSMI